MPRDGNDVERRTDFSGLFKPVEGGAKPEKKTRASSLPTTNRPVKAAVSDLVELAFRATHAGKPHTRQRADRPLDVYAPV